MKVIKQQPFPFIAGVMVGVIMTGAWVFGRSSETGETNTSAVIAFFLPVTLALLFLAHNRK